MSYSIITINREFESRGSEIAQEVARQLQLPYIDKFLITEAAAKSGIDISRIERTDEKLMSRFEYSQAEAADFYGGPASRITTTADIADVQFQLIRDIAQEGPCLIAGRCANYILRDREDVLNVFIHAGRDHRVQRTMEHMKLSEAAAVKLLKSTDKKRKAYYRNYTGMDWNDPNSYDLILNSDRLGEEKCVSLICDLYRG